MFQNSKDILIVSGCGINFKGINESFLDIVGLRPFIKMKDNM